MYLLSHCIGRLIFSIGYFIIFFGSKYHDEQRDLQNKYDIGENYMIQM